MTVGDARRSPATASTGPRDAWAPDRGRRLGLRVTRVLAPVGMGSGRAGRPRSHCRRAPTTLDGAHRDLVAVREWDATYYRLPRTVTVGVV